MTENKTDKVIRFVSITRGEFTIHTVPDKDGINHVVIADANSGLTFVMTYEGLKDVWSLMGEMLEELKGKNDHRLPLDTTIGALRRMAEQEAWSPLLTMAEEFAKDIVRLEAEVDRLKGKDQ